MISSKSHAELVNKLYSQFGQEGHRSFPITAYEIFMLEQAQQRANRKEAGLFRQLREIFDWTLSKRNQSVYLRKLQSGSTLILTDPSKIILWTSRNFLTMTGYSHSEAVGKTPGMLQGPDTDRATVLHIRESLRQAKAVKAELLNYRKGGETYRCRVQIDPLYNSQGNLTHFLAVGSELL